MPTCTSWSGRSRSAASISRPRARRPRCSRPSPRRPAGADGWLIGAGWRAVHWPGGEPEPHRSRARRRLRRSPGAAVGARPPHRLALVGSARAGADRRRAGRRARCGGRADGRAARDGRLGGGCGDSARRPSTRWTRRVARGLRRAHARGVTGHPRLPARPRPRDLAAAARRPAPDAARLGLAPGRAAGRDHRARRCAAAWATSGCASAPSRRSRTARSDRARPRMLEPFADAGRGEALLGDEELRDLAGRCGDAGLDLAVHAIGDARQPCRPRCAGGDARALGTARPAAAHRARAAARPRRSSALRRARRDRLHAALPRTLRPPGGRGRLGRAAAPAPTRSARWPRAARRSASARTPRSSRSIRWPASRPQRPATGPSTRRSPSSSRSTASGAARRTRRHAERRLGGCCPATPPTSSCWSATRSPARRTRSRASASWRRWSVGAGCTGGRRGDRSRTAARDRRLAPAPAPARAAASAAPP